MSQKRMSNRVHKHEDVPPFGECLANARKQLGLTGEELSKSVGLFRTAITRIERDHRSAHWETVYRTIVKGQLDLSYFFPADLILMAAESVLRQQRNRDRDKTSA
jgi:transcriptional regulator with XRE-family HTH domain